ncbi:MAG: methyltransferase domain-containing protein [Thermomicrobiales bacterium]|nr:methyltransferase domain-containing protein [Thermomicrobiales bacterium]
MSDQPTPDKLSPESPAAGEAYEPLTGRWSRLIAPAFVEWLDVPGGGRWLDVGCGTGALIQAILETQRPEEIIGVDPNSSFIAYARRQIHDARVRYEVGDARDLPVPSKQFHAVVAGLVLNHIEPAGQVRALTEMKRTARQGGVVGAYVWDYAAGLMPRVRFWEAATALDPGASAFDERPRYPICAPDRLAELARRAGLQAIETRYFEIEARFDSFADYWNPFLAGAGAASHYLMSLPAARQSSLRSHLEATLDANPDGSIVLPMRVVAVQGVA